MNLLELLPPQVRLTHTRYGLMLYPAGDVYIGRCLELCGEYCPGEGALFSQLLRPDDVVVEAGANIGAHTVLLARLVGAGGRVIAFEPQPAVFQMLCGNLALNGLVHVDARRQGVGAIPGVMRLAAPDIASASNFGGVPLRAEGSAGTESVTVATIDALGLDRLALIKIDVEGMEEAVIRGAAETIRRLRPVLYVENDAGFNGDVERSAALIATIRSLGYRLWWHMPGLWQPENFRGWRENIFDMHYVSINMLCVRDDLPVSTDLAEIMDDREVPILPPDPAPEVSPPPAPELVRVHRMEAADNVAIGHDL